MDQLLPFFLIIAASVFVSALFRKLHVPWVIALIVAGIALGPAGFGLIAITPTVQTFGTLGLIFLMFMAGLETRLSIFKEAGKGIFLLAALNGLIPLVVGVGVGYAFGFDFVSTALLGIIFVSSSVAVVVPALEARGIIHSRLGRTIVASAVVEDITSLVLLSLVLQSVDPVTTLPLPLFYLLLLAALAALRWLLPKIETLVVHSSEGIRPIFQQELRTVFAILLGTVVIFELLGLHPIIAGFFAGLVLSDSIKSGLLFEKLHTISYGLFIPVFFIIVGAQTDIGAFVTADGALVLTAAVVVGSVVAKFASGWLGGMVNRFSVRESAFIGAAMMPQLSTTLAVVFAAAERSLVPDELVAAMVALSVVTTFAAPVLLTVFLHERRTATETKPRR